MEELVTDGAPRPEVTIAPETSFEPMDEHVDSDDRGFNAAHFGAG